MLLQKYNDIEYDGVVIKLPKWFIKQNNLENDLNAFLESLKKCEYSLNLPDYQRSINEIEGGKEEYIQEKKSLKEEREKFKSERMEKYLNKSILNIVKIKDYQDKCETDSYKTDRIKFPNGDEVKIDNLRSTGKREVYSKVKLKELNKKVKELIVTNDDIIRFFEDNDYIMLYQSQHISLLLKYKAISISDNMFTENSQGDLLYKFEMNGVKVYINPNEWIEMQLYWKLVTSDYKKNGNKLILKSEKYNININITDDYILNDTKTSFIKK